MELSRKIKLNNALYRILEALLCGYIVFVPIVNTFNFWLFGNGIQVYLSILIIALTMTLRFMNRGQKRTTFHGLPILIIFLIELAYCSLRGWPIEIRFFLLYGLYVSFLSLPSEISRKSIFFSYYIAIYVAMFFTLLNGLSEEGISRTGGSVDGSITIVGIVLLLFLEEDFKVGKLYRALKGLSVIPIFVILLFGMSRARILIVALLIALKFLTVTIRGFSSGRVKVVYVLGFVVLIGLFLIALQLPVVQDLLEEVSNRFESGFSSEGRDAEAEYAWMLFRYFPILGGGYASYTFYDYYYVQSNYYNHNMYLAILARGGVVMALAFLFSFAAILKRVWNSKDSFLWILLSCILVLGYGNAGIFNYTIVGFLIPLVLGLRQYETPAQVGVKYGHHISLKRRV